WLLSKSGWRLIQNFVSDDSSDLFPVLDKNKNHFIELAGQKAVNDIYKKVLQRKMYSSIDKGDEVTFLKQLDSLKKLTDNKRDIAIIHCSYYIKNNNAQKFIETSNYYMDQYL